jgi:hypothetical protein
MKADWKNGKIFRDPVRSQKLAGSIERPERRAHGLVPVIDAAPDLCGIELPGRDHHLSQKNISKHIYLNEQNFSLP